MKKKLVSLKLYTHLFLSLEVTATMPLVMLECAMSITDSDFHDIKSYIRKKVITSNSTHLSTI